MNNEISSFADLALRPELSTVLATLGYEEPTPIQQDAIPALLSGRDVLGQAATGTGKTAAFALPILNAVPRDRQERFPLGLVLVPTRELAGQVSQAFHRYGSTIGVRVLAIYGGQPVGPQLAGLKRGVDVVIATPGRACDHLRRGTLDLSNVATVVLDEADEMLDMGFSEEIEEILQHANSQRQTALFSATMPNRLKSIAAQHLSDPLRITVQREKHTENERARVRQVAYLTGRPHKTAALRRILDVENPRATVVFCRTREEVDSLTESMNTYGYRAEALHGGVSQEQREKVLGRVRSESTTLLIATDVAARGLDIAHLTHVVNYNVPTAPEAYVHRIGRVGRAGREGVAMTIVEPREQRLLKIIERSTKQKIAVQHVPTLAELHARRAEITREELRTALTSDTKDVMGAEDILNSLREEFDLAEIAVAAVNLLHHARRGELPDEEIPAVAETPSRKKKPRRGHTAGAEGAHTTRVFFGVGRKHAVRPGDLVGAITGESQLRGRDIGAIEIADRFSLVEVPAAAADDVIDVLAGTTIRGRKVLARHDRDAGRGAPRRGKRKPTSSRR